MAQSRRASDRAAEHGTWHYILLGLSAGLLALVAGLAAVLIAIPAIAHGIPMTVLTGSMEPTLPPGTLVVVRPTPIDDIGVGTVLTYQMRSGDPAVVSHRVISRSVSSTGNTTFITKGDNSDLPDANPVTAPQIRGTVWYSVPWLGYVNNAVNGPNRRWIAPSAAGALFLYSGYMIAGSAVARLRKRRPSGAADGRGRGSMLSA